MRKSEGGPDITSEDDLKLLASTHSGSLDG